MKGVYFPLFLTFSCFIFSAYYFEQDNSNEYQYSYNRSTLSMFDVALTDSGKTGSSGKSLYERKCGICHALHSPSSYNYARWKEIMSIMKERAQLTKSENNLVMAYLKTNAKK